MARRLLERTNLSESETALLSTLLERKVVSTKQMSLLANRFDAPISARNTHRLLTRLERLKLVRSKDYVVSCTDFGYRAKIWRITKVGISRIISDENESFRLRKFWRDGFPSQTIQHILAINEVELVVADGCRNVGFEHEPKCHRTFSRITGHYGTEEAWLKPDLFAELGGEWRFFEIDMGSERTSRIIEKCKLYVSYFNYTYDKWKPNLPKVIWVVQDENRRVLLENKVKEKIPRHWHLFPCAILSEVRGKL